MNERAKGRTKKFSLEVGGIPCIMALAASLTEFIWCCCARPSISDLLYYSNRYA